MQKSSILALLLITVILLINCIHLNTSPFNTGQTAFLFRTAVIDNNSYYLGFVFHSLMPHSIAKRGNNESILTATPCSLSVGAMFLRLTTSDYINRITKDKESEMKKRYKIRWFDKDLGTSMLNIRFQLSYLKGLKRELISM